MKNETKSAYVEQIPALSEESKGTKKAQIILALSMPGKALHAFWLNPTQENLQGGTVQLVLEQNAKGKEPVEIEALLRIIGSANASALKQFMEKNLSLPSGQSTAAPAALANILKDL